MIILLTNKIKIIKWLIWTLGWREVFLTVWCQLVFSLLQLRFQHYVIANFVNGILILLKFLLDTNVNVLHSLIGGKLIYVIFLRLIDIFPCAVLLHSHFVTWIAHKNHIFLQPRLVTRPEILWIVSMLPKRLPRHY